MLENHLLHLVARVCVRGTKPLRAKRLVAALGRLFRPLSAREAVDVALRLEGRGTCLTRSLTLAARLPRAEIVIGGSRARGFAAHAWVEQDGEALSPKLSGLPELEGLRELVRLR